MQYHMARPEGLSSSRREAWGWFVFQFLIVFSVWSWDCPQCSPSSRTASSAPCKWEQPQHMSSALLLLPSLLSAVAALCTGAVLCKPLPALVTHSGDEFLPVAAPSHQSLQAASASSLETAFSWKLTCLAKVAHCCYLDYFQEWVDSNSNKLSCVWTRATSLHHFPAAARAAYRRFGKVEV